MSAMSSIVDQVSEAELSQMGKEGHKYLILSTGPNGSRVVIFTKSYKFDPFTKHVEFFTPKHPADECLVRLNTLFGNVQEQEIIDIVGDLGLILGQTNDRDSIDLLKQLYKEYRDTKKAWSKLLDHLRKTYKK